MQSQATYHNHKIKPTLYKVGDLVLLSGKSIHTCRPNKKLDFKSFGPYRISALVGKQAYRLNLPTSMRIHLVFHVSFLEPSRDRLGEARKPTMPVLVNNEEQ